MARPLRSKSAKDFKASILKALGAIDYESVLIRKMKDDIAKGDYTMFTTVLQLASKFVPKEVTSEGTITVQLELPRVNPVLVQPVDTIELKAIDIDDDIEGD